MIRSRPRLLRLLLSLLVLGVCMAGPGSDYNHPLSERLEQQLYDWRMRLNQKADLDPRIVIVDIDEPSLATIGHWPWPRETLAALLDRLFDHYGIGLMAFDVVFPEPDPLLTQQRLDNLMEHNPGQREALLALMERFDPDRRLADSLKDRPVILGYTFSAEGEAHTSGQLSRPVPIQRPEGLVDRIREAPGYSANLSPLQQAAMHGGFFDNPLLDSDGIYRQVPMLQRYRGELYPSLSLALMQTLLGVEAIELHGSGKGSVLEQLDLAGLKIPVDSRAAMLVPYRGPQGSFPYISARRVLDGTADPARLEGAIVLLGTSAAGLLDLRSTPVQNAYPGVEVHANLIAALLDQKMLHRPDYMYGANLLQCLLVGLLMVFLPPWLSALKTTLLAALLAGATLAGNLYLWRSAGHVLPLAPPLLVLLVLYPLQLLLGYVIETRSRQHLSGLFGQYVPPELVEEMQHQDSDFALGGESRRMSVLFSDIRGFTTLSEQLSPQQLTQLMNTYLTPMTAIVHEHRGTIDKYIGDALMAFWGAPLPDPEHSRHAVAAALEMLDRLETVNQQLAEQNLPPVSIGIGINSGEMSVGNMGSRFRMAYTVLGDAVNLASRLEGLTKSYGVPLIVSEQVVREAPDHRYLLLDRVRVKGKQQAVAIYQPLSDQLQIDEHWLKLHLRAMEAYRGQQWHAARTAFQQLLEAPLNPQLYRLYLQRIETLQQQPPNSDWDGVYVFDHK